MLGALDRRVASVLHRTVVCAAVSVSATVCMGAPGVDSISLPPLWQVKLDPGEAGVREKWFSRTPGDGEGEDWQSISTHRWLGWDKQGMPEHVGFAWYRTREHLPETSEGDWQETEIGRYWADDYVGIGWYRRAFDSPAIPEDGAAFLHFGAVDESCWVWINGIFVGSHDIGPDGWDKPFRLEITEALRPGENHIAVRAENVAYAGGIWQPVTLELYAPPTQPNGGLE